MWNILEYMWNICGIYVEYIGIYWNICGIYVE